MLSLSSTVIAAAVIFTLTPDLVWAIFSSLVVSLPSTHIAVASLPIALSLAAVPLLLQPSMSILPRPSVALACPVLPATVLAVPPTPARTAISPMVRGCLVQRVTATVIATGGVRVAVAVGALGVPALVSQLVVMSLLFLLFLFVFLLLRFLVLFFVLALMLMLVLVAFLLYLSVSFYFAPSRA